MANLIDQYDPIIQAAGREWNVDPTVLKALLTHESGGRADAVGSSGEVGLGQIMPATGRHLGMTDLRDPAQSIYGAAKYLNEALVAERENPAAALRYYNGGPGWRGSNSSGNAAYPGYVAGQYQRLAKADTGAMTDATPGGPDPAKMTDAEWLDAQAKTYPGLAGPNAPAGKEPPAVPDKSGAPTTDDLLTRMRSLAPPGGAVGQGGGAGAAAPAETAAPTSDDLLRRMGQIAPPAETTKAPAETATQPAEISAGAVDEYGRPMNPLAQAPTPPTSAGLDAAVRNALAPAPGTKYADILPLAQDEKTGAIRFAMPNMLRAPLIGLTSEGPQLDASGKLVVPGATIDPGTGTLGVTPEAASVAQFGARPLNVAIPTAPSVATVLRGRVAEATAARPQDAVSGVNPLSPEAAARAAGQPVGPTEPAAGPPPAPAPAPAEAGPQPAGAQVSGAAGLTPEQELAYRSTAEGRKLIEQQEPGVPDRNAYVPGVTPNLAEQEQNVAMSRELKALKIASPAASQADIEAAAANNAARQQHFERVAGSSVDVANAVAARAEQAKTDLKATWANKTEADAQPVIDQAQAILDSPDGLRPAVRNAVNSVTAELRKSNGELHSDPEMLYGVRKHIDDLLSKEGQRETPLSARATANLQALKDVLDGQIEAAAPGFKQYLKNFSDASRKIDEMRVLQDHESKLYDAQGRMGFNRVQTMMRNIVDSRSAPGINPYKSITDETMGKLWALRDDLRRSSTALELARATGSDTAQNAMDIAKQYAKLGGVAGVHAIANLIKPGLGGLAVRGVSGAIAPFRAARMASRQAARAQQIINPQNALIDPNAAP